MHRPRRIDAVERITMPSRDTFEKEYLEAGRPVIITDGLKNWKALSKWNREFFQTGDVGQNKVPIEQYIDKSAYKFPIWSVRNMKEMLLKDYVDIVFSEDNDNYYLADQDIDWLLPELWGDVEVPPLFNREELQRSTLYLGRDTTSALHYHPDTQVFLCQILGRKKFIFWHPDDTDKLYPLPWYSPNFNWSQVDFSDPGVYDKYPRLREAQPIEVTLEPGEMIFVPLHWWHLVHGYDFSVSVIFVWGARFAEWPFPRPGLRTLASALVNNELVAPLLPKQIAAAERAQLGL